MSQVTRVRTQFRNAHELLAAMEELGLEVTGLEALRRRVAKGEEVSEISVTNTDAGALKFRRVASGSFEVTASERGMTAAVQRQVTRIENQIRRTYAYKMVLAEATRAGFQIVQEEKEGQKEIRLVVRRFA